MVLADSLVETSSPRDEYATLHKTSRPRQLRLELSYAKPSYKVKLAEENNKHKALLGSLSNSLQTKFDLYYKALSGDYAYVDNHTGKVVHARTYKKRMEFAKEQLEGLEISLKMHQRYGKITNMQAKSFLEHTRSLYNTAIRDNKYLKNKKTKQTSVAQRLRSQIQSLETRIDEGIDSKNIYEMLRAPTKYTKFSPETSTQTAPIDSKPKRLNGSRDEFMQLVGKGLAAFADLESTRLLLEGTNKSSTITLLAPKNATPKNISPYYNEVNVLTVEDELAVDDAFAQAGRVYDAQYAGVNASSIPYHRPQISDLIKSFIPKKAKSWGLKSMLVAAGMMMLSLSGSDTKKSRGFDYNTNYNINPTPKTSPAYYPVSSPILPSVRSEINTSTGKIKEDQNSKEENQFMMKQSSDRAIRSKTIGEDENNYQSPIIPHDKQRKDQIYDILQLKKTNMNQNWKKALIARLEKSRVKFSLDNLIT